MTAPFLSSRDKLAAALRDFNVPSLAGDEPVAQHWVNSADALLASGVVVTPDVYLAGLAEDEAVRLAFSEALGEQARKYAVNRATPNGPPVWSVTLAQLPGIAHAALAAALATPTTEDQ